MNNLTDIGSRFMYYLDQKRLSQREVARLSGQNSAQVSNIVNGKEYGMGKLIKILNVLPDLSVAWLMTGQGNMLVPQPKLNDKSIAADANEPSSAYESGSHEFEASQQVVLSNIRALDKRLSHIEESLSRVSSQVDSISKKK